MLKGIKWRVVLLTFAIVFVILLGTFQIYQNKLLPDKISKDISGVEYVRSVIVQNAAQGYAANIKLDRVDDLMKTYKEIEKKTEKYSVKIDIRIIDNTDGKLNNIYYNSQFAIYEALQKGDYMKMNEVIKNDAEKVGALSHIYIDRENIYVDLRDGSNYLYRIIPREIAKGDNQNG